MNEMHNYSINKEQAIQEMLNMNKRAKKDTKNEQKIQPDHTSLNFMQISLDSDAIKILGIILVLMGDCSDMLLIFALIYILI